MSEEGNTSPTIDTKVEETKLTEISPTGESKTTVSRSEQTGVAAILNDPETFKNRRRMAWICLVLLQINFIYIMAFISIDRIGPLEGIIGGYFAAMITVVLGYFGFTTWQSISFVKNGPKDKTP